MGGGNLANHNKKKGFAISGILYPILILTLFLVVQVLFMLQTRKNVLDKARTELADSVNRSNQIYTNEELSTIVDEITGKFLDKTYPVGSIYISYSSTNPSSLFGGTWVSYGSGKTLVGVNTAESEFNTVGKTGGSKTHTLTEAEMPNHDHDFLYQGGRYAFHFTNKPGGNIMFYLGDGNSGDARYVKISSDGGNQPHNNLQPYITVYMWRRTA